jgi:hypothetical protein
LAGDLNEHLHRAYSATKPQPVAGAEHNDRRLKVQKPRFGKKG